MNLSRSRTVVPTTSKVFGYGPMLPFFVGALGTWCSPRLSPVAIGLTVIWGALIMAFLGGVRRGFGFGDPSASTKAEILTMIVYVTIGGMASILGSRGFMLSSVLLLAVGYILVPIADARAAKSGDAPAHFATLRPRQISIAVISLLAICVNLIVR